MGSIFCSKFFQFRFGNKLRYKNVSDFTFQHAGPDWINVKLVLTEFCDFQMAVLKVVIELRVEQVLIWFYIVLLSRPIRKHAYDFRRSFDFKKTPPGVGVWAFPP